MAVKKNTSSKSGDSAPKAAKEAVAKKVATSPTAVESRPTATAKAPAKAKAPVAAATSTKVDTPKAGPARPATLAVKKTAPRVVAPIKLTDRQKDFLKTISAAKEQGYTTARKAEQKTIDALLDRKLIKRGAKDKQGGGYCYLVSKAGEKHLST